MGIARTVILLHGAGEESYAIARDQWSVSIQNRCGPDGELLVPALPNPDSPSYGVWSRYIAGTLTGTGATTTLVAHSVAGSVVLKLLSEMEIEPWPQEIHVLAAPFWCGLDRDRQVEEDDIVPVSHLDEYAAAFPEAHVRRRDDEATSGRFDHATRIPCPRGVVGGSSVDTDGNPPSCTNAALLEPLKVSIFMTKGVW